LFVFQRFPRQKTEDGEDPPSKWGKDREESDKEDPDNEDFMPIPHAGPGPTPGKTPARDPLREWPDDDESDCEILEILDPKPLAFTFPPRPTLVIPEEQVLDVPPLATGGRVAGKKRAGTGPQKPQKRRKVLVKPRTRPMATG
jgi:hypothetical protein